MTLSSLWWKLRLFLLRLLGGVDRAMYEMACHVEEQAVRQLGHETLVCSAVEKKLAAAQAKVALLTTELGLAQSRYALASEAPVKKRADKAWRALNAVHQEVLLSVFEAQSNHVYGPLVTYPVPSAYRKLRRWGYLAVRFRQWRLTPRGMARVLLLRGEEGYREPRFCPICDRSGGTHAAGCSVQDIARRLGWTQGAPEYELENGEENELDTPGMVEVRCGKHMVLTRYARWDLYIKALHDARAWREVLLTLKEGAA